MTTRRNLEQAPAPAVPVSNELPLTGLVRLSTVLQFIPVSKSTWWEGVRTGRFPQPIKLGPRTTCWRAADISKMIYGEDK
ncbi:AlpA family phage regulatory protein [Geomonas sp. Red32]|uniref:helix-turn-helix transcriptional regulator n=1 Tax=Geomonas sp. Red32 TaxID=2912856 RepID=UPI00202CD8D9|nr:AlpA family phage regulatory protein [Geomonas sp. Red32]MCM0083941.1 AlpA family phage regulatory protein [Geomonas sp. Red32]